MPNKVSRHSACRLIVDPPANGAWNMAVDELLLESMDEASQPTLRIYRWQRPTLSLGYFQKSSQRRSHQPSLGADVVRRLSGGGAILHDQEITYSLVLPITHPLANKTQVLYDTVHQAIVEWLSEFVAMAETSRRLDLCRPPKNEVRTTQPFLCFQRRSPGDVLLVDGASDSEDYKIVGSAQRRRRGSVLQHGSILWTTSQSAPEIQGFTNLIGLSVPLEDALKTLSSRVLESLQMRGEDSQLDCEESARARKTCSQRYDLSAWTERR